MCVMPRHETHNYAHNMRPILTDYPVAWCHRSTGVSVSLTRLRCAKRLNGSRSCSGEDNIGDQKRALNGVLYGRWQDSHERRNVDHREVQEHCSHSMKPSPNNYGFLFMRICDLLSFARVCRDILVYQVRTIQGGPKNCTFPFAWC